MTNLIFNRENTDWKTGKSSLFLGQRLGLHDSINVPHPELLAFYDNQRKIDWSHDEVSLQTSRQDMLKAPKDLVGLMIDNLSYQWEIDSVASRAFACLLSPFITNSEFWAACLKNQEMELVHSRTYSEINRQCIPDPNQIFKSMASNEFIKERSVLAYKYLNELDIAGCKYKLGQYKDTDQELFDIVFMGYLTIYLVERLQFCSSFSSTFISAENGYFRGICLLVQKILIDEWDIHAAVGDYVLRFLIKNDPRAAVTMDKKEKEIKKLLHEFLQVEYTFNKKIFKGRKILGLNAELNNHWAEFNYWFASDTLGFAEGTRPNCPLVYMSNWLDIDKVQNANQEIDNNNYTKIHLQCEVDPTEILSV
jgi:ribonucleoside-diphosphate reductase beta chain